MPDCNCYIDEDRDNADEVSYSSINYCHLHASAATYRTLLQRIVANPPCGYGKDCCPKAIAHNAVLAEEREMLEKTNV